MLLLVDVSGCLLGLVAGRLVEATRRPGNDDLRLVDLGTVAVVVHDGAPHGVLLGDPVGRGAGRLGRGVARELVLDGLVLGFLGGGHWWGNPPETFSMKAVESSKMRSASLSRVATW